MRATNAQFDSPEILRRLDVRLLEVRLRCWGEGRGEEMEREREEQEEEGWERPALE